MAKSNHQKKKDEKKKKRLKEKRHAKNVAGAEVIGGAVTEKDRSRGRYLLIFMVVFIISAMIFAFSKM